MTSITLPIFGAGSQPDEADGASLDYLPMPGEMATFAMPHISADLNSQDLSPARRILELLQQQLDAFPSTGEAIDLTGLDADNRRLLAEVLGEGEVAMQVTGPRPLRIQESVLAGVWRLQKLDSEGRLLQDALEVGAAPRSVLQSAFTGAARQIDVAWSTLPDGVMNAPPLLAELNAKIAGYQPGAEAHSINLSLLPQTEQDLAFLSERLGDGTVTILSRGYGNCRISATGTAYVWWVRYFNSQETLILNTLEVSDLPNVACASIEDIADSRERLREIVKVSC